MNSMHFISTLVRVVTVFSSIFVFLGHVSLVRILIKNRWRRVRRCNHILRHYCRLGLWLLRVRVKIEGAEHLGITDLHSVLMVGNHLSYLDVLVISSSAPACFVTSHEIKETPFLGQICQLAGCLFVERRNKLNIHNEVKDIRQALEFGLNVAIFPEATSTNGEQILRFRRPLFVAAIDAGRPVLPFCLNYRSVAGETVNTESRDKVFWYGDMAFAPHVWSLAACGGVDVSLHFLPPISTNEKMDPTDLAMQSQLAVESVFQPVVVGMTASN